MKKITIACRGSSTVDIDSLKEFQGELKGLSKENYTKLKKEIIELGFTAPIFTWGRNILDGHQRIRTLKKMRDEGFIIPRLPIVEVDAKNEKEAKKKVLAFTSQYGNIVPQGLYEFLSSSDLEFDDVKDSFRFPEIDFKKFEAEFYKEEPVEGEDEIPEVKNAFVSHGDLWTLGSHRLLCGDSTDASQIERLMNGEKADMVYTDPPYGMNLDTDYSKMKGSKNSDRPDLAFKSYRPVIGDDAEFDFKKSYSFFETCDEQFWWGADYYCQQIPKNGGFLVWDKTGGHDSLMNAGFGSNFELCWTKQKHKRDLCRYTYKAVAGMKPEDGKRVHPTQKPVGLAEWFFERWGKDKTNIVDLYLGSGSTLIACEKTNRKCFGMEIDENYCSVIIERWQKFTGKKAILESAIKTAGNQHDKSHRKTIQKRAIRKSEGTHSTSTRSSRSSKADAGRRRIKNSSL